MIRLISGGSASGKSEYAEGLICQIRDGSDEPVRLVYLATMKADCLEAIARIERHRHLRKGKGFETVEYSDGFDTVLARMDKQTAVLLEDLPNMLSCNMYSPEGETDDGARDRILDEIARIEGSCRELIIVTDDIFSDGVHFDESVEKYRRALASLNIELAAMAGGVTEVVAGIPIEHRKSESTDL